MSNETVLALATIMVVGFALFILALLLATPSGTVEICLSKKEARELFPRAHLYWYGPHHCWSNRRGGPPKGLKVDPLPKEVMAQAQKKEAPAKGPEVKMVSRDEYNELDAAADQDVFFHAQPFELYRSFSVYDPYVFAELWRERFERAWRTPR